MDYPRLNFLQKNNGLEFTSQYNENNYYKCFNILYKKYKAPIKIVYKGKTSKKKIKILPKIKKNRKLKKLDIFLSVIFNYVCFKNNEYKLLRFYNYSLNKNKKLWINSTNSLNNYHFLETIFYCSKYENYFSMLSALQINVKFKRFVVLFDWEKKLHKNHLKTFPKLFSTVRMDNDTLHMHSWLNFNYTMNYNTKKHIKKKIKQNNTNSKTIICKKIIKQKRIENIFQF